MYILVFVCKIAHLFLAVVELFDSAPARSLSLPPLVSSPHASHHVLDCGVLLLTLPIESISNKELWLFYGCDRDVSHRNTSL